MPVLIDYFCGAGGAAKGYADAGFTVIGVDHLPMPHYPYDFIQADAMECLADPDMNAEADVIHASPPCQGYSHTRFLTGKQLGVDHPDLVGPTRELLKATGKPYVIENVEGAPLIGAVLLCGTMFGLRVYRHRLFETNMQMYAPAHPRHEAKTHRPYDSRYPVDDEEGGFFTVAGGLTPVRLASPAMGIDWMTLAEITQAIPPAYTAELGRQALAFLESGAELVEPGSWDPRHPLKQCIVCDQLKAREQYYDDTRTYDGKRTKCRACFSAQVQARKRVRNTDVLAA